MRIWSIHPSYLDSKGLVALWRETLLAQNVLLDKTKGYKKHPQLTRFKRSKKPTMAIANYLLSVSKEADDQDYNFNKNKIGKTGNVNLIQVTTGQVEYEFKHLLEKLKTRNPKKYKEIKVVKKIEVHPLFVVIDGTVEEWEVLPQSAT